MKAIIIDRDGVINEERVPHVCNLGEWVAIPNSLEAIARLNQLQYHVFVASNQSGIGKGLYSLETLNAIHDKMHAELKRVGGVISDIAYCPHHPAAGCDCRKPKPGLLHQLAKKYHLDLSDIFFIGDSWSDVLAAQAAGAKPILVRSGKGWLTVAEHQTAIKNMQLKIFDDLFEVVKWIACEE